jgi:probable HAF family extracellular repeat protein
MNNQIISHSFKRMMSGFCSTALIAWFALGGSNAFAQNAYKVTDLGVLPSKEESIPAAINGQGLVSGTSRAETSGEAAFRYNPNNPAPMEDIGQSTRGIISRAFGINNTGVVVGDSASIASITTDSPVRHAVLFGDRSRIDLGTLQKQLYSRANSINDFNQVVGFSGPALDTPKSRAFFWSKSTGMIDLGTLGGAYAQAFAINDSGFITGNSQLRSTVSDTHAFLAPSPIGAGAMGMRDLGTLGGSFSYGMAINARNHVVGYSTINKVDSRVHAFLFDGNVMKDLGSLAGTSSTAPEDQSVALGINSSSQVVGHSYLPGINPNTDPAIQPVASPVQQVAFVWSLGVMRDLNKLIGTAAETYHLNSATAINDKGQIVATALSKATGTHRAVLLTPITPVPSN